MKRYIVTVILFLTFLKGITFAVEQSTFYGMDGAVYIDNNQGYGVTNGGFAPISYTPVTAPEGYIGVPGDPGRKLGSGWGGVKATTFLSHKIKIPFLQGNNVLTSGNNVLFNMKGFLSPISSKILFSATITPIAFLNFQTGYCAGTGWDFFGIFTGLGLVDKTTGDTRMDSFSGIVSRAWLAATFQFDLGAIMPGKWNHIITLVQSKLQYQNFSAAGADDPWQFENDDGEDFNGYRYKGTYLLGYSLPFKIKTIAFLLETEQNLFKNKDRSPMADGGWGSDFIKMTFGPLATIKLSGNSSITVLVQFAREKNYTEETIFNNYFENREYSGSYIQFQRIAFSYSKKW